MGAFDRLQARRPILFVSLAVDWAQYQRLVHRDGPKPQVPPRDHLGWACQFSLQPEAVCLTAVPRHFTPQT